MSFEYWKKITIEGADVENSVTRAEHGFYFSKKSYFGVKFKVFGDFWVGPDSTNAFLLHKRLLAPRKLKFFKIVLKDQKISYYIPSSHAVPSIL